jgi:hypothetical protein
VRADVTRYQFLSLAFAVGLILAATAGGCAIPDYHLPSGFSSTYYRHLQQSQGTMSAPLASETVVTEPLPRRWWSFGR